MTAIISELSDDLIIEAMVANSLEFFGLFKNAPGVETSSDGDVQWFLTGVPFPLLNGVLRTNLDSSNADLKIRAVLDRFDDRSLPMIWSVTPLSRPRDLRQRLEAHGLRHGGDSPSMAADLMTLPVEMDKPAGLDIHLIDNDSDLKTWCEVLSSIFRFPDFVSEAFFNFLKIPGYGEDAAIKNYVGLEDGRVVAVSSVILGGGVAGIYNVGTIPAARRKGFGRAITLAPLLEARRLDYHIGVLQASKMGVDLYSNLGFKEYCTFSRYLSTPGSTS